jgi:hypothetical protein
MSKKIMSVLLTLLFTCLALFSLGEFGFFPVKYACMAHAYPVIARVSVALYPRFEQNFMHTHYQIHHEIASGQTPNEQM